MRRPQSADESSPHPSPHPISAPPTPIPTSTAARATFIFVSVVIIARANISACAGVSPSAAFSAGNAAITFSAGNGTPIIPVEEGKTSSKMQSKLSAAAAQVCTHASIPGCPVAQFAFPAFTSTAPTRPPVAARCRRPTVTGAATTWFFVNIAAPFAPLPPQPPPDPVLPLTLIPAFTAPQTKPCGNGPISHYLLTLHSLYSIKRAIKAIRTYPAFIPFITVTPCQSAQHPRRIRGRLSPYPLTNQKHLP